VTRQERIQEFSILLQQLKHEQRVEDWLEAHTSAIVTTGQAIGPGGVKFYCIVTHHGEAIARSFGNDERDAKAHAFSTIFLAEANARGAS
jgi:hypothetical protein